MPTEIHISSLVVHSTPSRLQSVSRRIATIPGALVHGSSPAGKLVVTLDANSDDEMLTRVTEIQRIDGVLSAALVYQYGGGPEATDAELGHAG